MAWTSERLKRLIDDVVEIFSKEPQLHRISEGRFLVVGDTHGDADTTVRAIRYAEREGLGLVFLGDYVDRGPKQIENIGTLLEAKVSWGSRLIMLRGNHESSEMNYWYGFQAEVARRLGPHFYEHFAQLFSQIPYGAILYDRILMVHGGLARGLERVEEIEGLPKGEVDPMHPIAFQIVWNDPSEDIEWFAPSWRGGGAQLFGWRAFREFMARNGLELMLRAHEPQDMGYGYLFENRLLTIFSCRYYGVRPAAAIVSRDGVEKIIYLSD